METLSSESVKEESWETPLLEIQSRFSETYLTGYLTVLLKKEEQLGDNFNINMYAV